jgi:hypothetical protein
MTLPTGTAIDANLAVAIDRPRFVTTPIAVSLDSF